MSSHELLRLREHAAPRMWFIIISLSSEELLCQPDDRTPVLKLRDVCKIIMLVLLKVYSHIKGYDPKMK